MGFLRERKFALFGGGSHGDLGITLVGSRAACGAVRAKGKQWHWGWRIHCSVAIHEENGVLMRKGNSLFIMQSALHQNLLISSLNSVEVQ